MALLRMSNNIHSFNSQIVSISFIATKNFDEMLSFACFSLNGSLHISEFILHFYDILYTNVIAAWRIFFFGLFVQQVSGKEN